MHACVGLAANMTTFVPAASPALRFATRPTVALSLRPPLRRYSVFAASAARMSAEEDAGTTTSPTTGAATAVTEEASSPFKAPSFDTAVFSNFVENAQGKIDELQNRISEIDAEAVVEDVKVASIGLVDNLIAGDWLNRGELYGAVQLLFAILLLRSPGFLDNVFGFVFGPATLFTGAAIAVKALFDLGRKQLSIWPAPVPGGELRTDGMYSYVRHPLYAGVLLSTLGYAVATASPERVALTAAFAFFLAKKVDVEEEYLVRSYPDYTQYQEKVPFKFVPRIF